MTKLTEKEREWYYKTHRRPQEVVIAPVEVIENKPNTPRGYHHNKPRATWNAIKARVRTQEGCYLGASLCEEWENYRVFERWLKSQDNYDRWLNTPRWAIDKDIRGFGAKIYSPKTCSLVPPKINSLAQGLRVFDGTGKVLPMVAHYAVSAGGLAAGMRAYKIHFLEEGREAFAQGEITEECFLAIEVQCAGT